MDQLANKKNISVFTTVPLGFSFASVPCVTDNAPFPSVSKKNFVINSRNVGLYRNLARNRIRNA